MVATSQKSGTSSNFWQRVVWHAAASSFAGAYWQVWSRQQVSADGNLSFVA